MLKTEILLLRSQNKTYTEICNILQCSKSLVSYYCNKESKQKKNERQRLLRQKQHPYTSKVHEFRYKKNKKHRSKINNTKYRQLIQWKIHNFKGNDMTSQFSVDDVINKFGDNPKCALTGQEIDIYSPRTYHFDHKIPTSRGGDNSLDNLQIVTKQANLAKSDLTNDEFIHLCKQVLENAGYKLSK